VLRPHPTRTSDSGHQASSRARRPGPPDIGQARLSPPGSRGASSGVGRRTSAPNVGADPAHLAPGCRLVPIDRPHRAAVSHRRTRPSTVGKAARSARLTLGPYQPTESPRSHLVPTAPGHQVSVRSPAQLCLDSVRGTCHGRSSIDRSKSARLAVPSLPRAGPGRRTAISRQPAGDSVRPTGPTRPGRRLAAVGPPVSIIATDPARSLFGPRLTAGDSSVELCRLTGSTEVPSRSTPAPDRPSPGQPAMPLNLRRGGPGPTIARLSAPAGQSAGTSLALSADIAATALPAWPTTGTEWLRRRTPIRAAHEPPPVSTQFPSRAEPRAPHNWARRPLVGVGQRSRGSRRWERCWTPAPSVSPNRAEFAGQLASPRRTGAVSATPRRDTPPDRSTE